MKAFLGSAWRDFTSARAFVNGSWRSLLNGKAYVGGEWRDIANFVPPGPGGGGGGTLALSISPSAVYGESSTETVAAGATATPSGGQAPYTYSWAKQSGGAITAQQPTNASTLFTASLMGFGEVREAVFRCTCTDSLGSTGTADVTVTLYRSDPSGNQ